MKRLFYFILKIILKDFYTLFDWLHFVPLCYNIIVFFLFHIVIVLIALQIVLSLVWNNFRPWIKGIFNPNLYFIEIWLVILDWLSTYSVGYHIEFRHRLDNMRTDYIFDRVHIKHSHCNDIATNSRFTGKCSFKSWLIKWLIDWSIDWLRYWLRLLISSVMVVIIAMLQNDDGIGW